MTSPFVVSWHNASSWLRILLSPTERSHPRLLVLNAGLLTCGALLVVQDTAYSVYLRYVTRMGLNMYIARLLAAPLIVLIKTPLSVILTRLCVQRNTSMDDAACSEEAPLVNATHSSREENVVRCVSNARCSFSIVHNGFVDSLRENEVPYAGFMDCIKQIVAEEGYSTFFRAWWYEFALHVM